MMVSPYIYVGLATTKLRPRGDVFEHALSVVIADFGISRGQLMSRRRWRYHVFARQVLSYICRVHYGMKLTRIANLLGGRHHSTILHNIRQHHHDDTYDAEYREVCSRIMRKVFISL